jgi:hypothetical protein
MHVLTSVIASGQLTGKDFAAAHQAELEAVQA